MKTTEGITLSDLMGEDFDVWVTRNKEKGFNLEIDDEDGYPVIMEEMIHPFAMEGFYDFCKRYINAYETAIERGGISD